jgi:hypothetical protein
VLLPPRISQPTPALLRPCVPAISKFNVALLPAARLLTVMVGVPAAASVRMFAALPPLPSSQLPAVALVVSPNCIVPIVRASVRTTLASAVMLRVLKFASKPAPSAMGPAPAFQLAMSPQFPPARFVQVPLSARAELAAVKAAAAAAVRSAKVRFTRARRPCDDAVMMCPLRREMNAVRAAQAGGSDDDFTVSQARQLSNETGEILHDRARYPTARRRRA